MDNNKNYKWSPEDKITITGEQFDVFQRTVAVMSEVLTTFLPIAIQTRKDVIESMIAENIAKEMPETEEVVEEESEQPPLNPS
jgi:hypothetical protein